MEWKCVLMCECECVCVLLLLYVCVWVNVWFIERFMHLMCRALLPVKLDSNEKKSNARTRAQKKKTAVSTTTTTNNHFEMFALKHYKAFQFIQIKWNCFYFHFPFAEEQKKLLLNFVLFVNLFLYSFLSFSSSPSHSISTKYCCRSWPYTWVWF